MFLIVLDLSVSCAESTCDEIYVNFKLELG
jgi:hypothetical protein